MTFKNRLLETVLERLRATFPHFKLLALASEGHERFVELLLDQVLPKITAQPPFQQHVPDRFISIKPSQPVYSRSYTVCLLLHTYCFDYISCHIGSLLYAINIL